MRKIGMVMILCIMLSSNILSVSAKEDVSDEVIEGITYVESNLGNYEIVPIALSNVMCSKCNIPMNYVGETVQQDWTLIKTEACPNNSVGGGDPAKYHYTYIRRVAYRYACTKCGYTYKQIATETKYVNTCNEH